MADDEILTSIVVVSMSALGVGLSKKGTVHMRTFQLIAVALLAGCVLFGLTVPVTTWPRIAVVFGGAVVGLTVGLALWPAVARPSP